MNKTESINHKLALGTVQFGLPYGINNNRGIISDEEVNKILNIASSNGIEMLDTASSYGTAEQKIGKFSEKRFDIVTKIPTLSDLGSVSENDILKQIDLSLNRLQVHNLYGVLLHNPSQLIEQNGNKIILGLQQAQSAGKLKKIGISVYTTEELQFFFNSYDFDIVQVPFNILDRRLLKTDLLLKLKEKGVEIHARSVFLQGLLLMPPSKRPKRFDKWKNLWKIYDDWLIDTGMSALEANLRYAASFPFIDKIVVGIDGADHLESIIKAANGSIPYLPKSLQTEDIELLNPLMWLNDSND